MVIEKTCSGFYDVVISGHGVCPFGEVVYCDNNLLVATFKMWVVHHEFYAPFAKRACANDSVEPMICEHIIGNVHMS